MPEPITDIEGVLIVGGGVVGLTAALCLVDQGIPVTVLEAEAELVRDYRGSTFHPPTLDMLNALGLARKLVDMGVVSKVVQFRDRTEGVIAEFDLGLLREHTMHPFRLQIDQYALSVLLYERLHTSPDADVKFGHRVTKIEYVSGTPVMTADTPDGPRSFKARYVIGADGGNSVVRQSLGIGFEGMTYPERYVTLFTPMDLFSLVPGLTNVNYISDPGEWVVMLRNPEVWRLLFPIRTGESDRDALEEDAVQRRLAGVAGTEGPFPVTDRRIYRVHQRVAGVYRCGKVLLAGDAAHVNNPMGGMGLNGGIHDAVSLAETLARSWDQSGGESLLDDYARIRRKAAVDYIQAQSHSNAMAMDEKDPHVRKQNNDRLRKLASDPDLALNHLLNTSMISGLKDTKTTLIR